MMILKTILLVLVIATVGIVVWRAIPDDFKKKLRLKSVSKKDEKKDGKTDGVRDSAFSPLYFFTAIALLFIADYAIHLCFPNFFRWLLTVHPGRILLGVCILIAHFGVMSFAWNKDSRMRIPGIVAGTALYLVLAIVVIWPVRSWGPHVRLYTFGMGYAQPSAENYPPPLLYESAYAEYDVKRNIYIAHIPVTAQAVVVKDRGMNPLHIPDHQHLIVCTTYYPEVQWPKPYNKRYGIGYDGAIQDTFSMKRIMVKEMDEYKQWKNEHPREQFTPHDDAQFGSLLVKVGDEFKRAYPNPRVMVFIPDTLVDRRVYMAVNLPLALLDNERGKGKIIVHFRFQESIQSNLGS